MKTLLRIIQLGIILSISAFNLIAQENDTCKVAILPTGGFFEPIYTDPQEAQTFVTVCPLFLVNKKKQESVYMPFSLGFVKTILRWKKYELGFDALVNTQFEWKKNFKNVNSRYMISGDYKISSFFNIQFSEKFTLRNRLWHISVHEANDYIYENRLATWKPDPVNYEQFDMTLEYKQSIFIHYLGGGAIVRPDLPLRKRIASQIGTMLDKSIRKKLSFIAGIDAKMLQQFDYRPNIKIVAGLKYGQSRSAIKFIIEYYNGHTPYSKFEERMVEWLGFGIYFNPC